MRIPEQTAAWMPTLLPARYILVAGLSRVPQCVRFVFFSARALRSISFEAGNRRLVSRKFVIDGKPLAPSCVQGAELDEATSQMQELILDLVLPEELLSPVLDLFGGPRARLVVRSSANVEDLEGRKEKTPLLSSCRPQCRLVVCDQVCAS